MLTIADKAILCGRWRLLPSMYNKIRVQKWMSSGRGNHHNYSQSCQNGEGQGSSHINRRSNLSPINIPLITKRMNSVQKYISAFEARDSPKMSQNSRTLRLDHLTSRNQPVSHYGSPDPHEFTSLNDSTRLPKEQRHCVEYTSLAEENSEQRLERLSRLEQDYGLLKQRLSPHHRNHLGLLTARKYATDKSRQPDISQQDIEHQLKNTVVKENGKQYFADLYLLKKGRDDIMSSLSKAGKLAMGTTDPSPATQLTYEDKVRAKQKQFVCRKILKDREVKKSKMMKGRNLHWNVYYDMLALSATERHKLKEICKFSNTFDIS